VMDHHGNVKTGLTTDNYFPLCTPKPTDPTQRAAADTFLAAHSIRGNPVPYCPDGFVTPARNLKTQKDPLDFTDGRKWAARGAINAAQAVFVYLDHIERNAAARKPLYNQCKLLTPAP
jgi:hypothetical protein